MSQSSTSPAPRNPWMVGPVPDWFLFLATPVLIIPLILGLEAYTPQLFGVNRELTRPFLYMMIMGLGATGHHLPGMMRAYGDRELFQRFRLRFVLSPIIFLTLCIVFSVQHWQGMVFAVYVWGIWHGMMQTYGIARIYDGKIGSLARRTARLDLALCAVWFLGIVALSDKRVGFIQHTIGVLGVPALSATNLAGLQNVVLAVVVAMTVVWILHHAIVIRNGGAFSLQKTIFLVSNVAFFGYANLAFDDPFFGVLFFEIFHDVQYLTIVWLFNLKRTGSGANVGGFTSFVFRPRVSLLLLYLALVLAYGGVGPILEVSLDNSRRTTMDVIRGLLLASALLHFYFDGFIWKVRERSTGANLGIAGSTGGDIRVTGHALKWLLFLVPAALFWYFESQRS